MLADFWMIFYDCSDRADFAYLLLFIYLLFISCLGRQPDPLQFDHSGGGGCEYPSPPNTAKARVTGPTPHPAQTPHDYKTQKVHLAAIYNC